MSGVTGDIKKLFNFKYKVRNDSATDQYNRLLMVKALLVAAFLTGMNWWVRFICKQTCFKINCLNQSSESVLYKIDCSKDAALQPATLLKEVLQRRRFPMNYVKFLRTTIL